MKPDEDLASALRAAGLRVTRQRAAILRVLSEAQDHPDAHELHRRARAIDDSVSIATVYRTMSALEEQGAVQRHAFGGPSSRYETTDAPHHDHIIDVESGAVIEFVSPEIERLQREEARRRGYEVVSHRLELFCRKL